MSGLEIAGLVLGALPVAIKAAQGYRETLYAIKNVQRDLRYIERDLETEQLILQNTCEALLVSIVPPTKIHSMIEHPFGPEWKSNADQLNENLLIIYYRRLRLYTSYGKFEEHIMDMLKATEDLSLKLNIGDNSQVNSSDKASILEALKQNASFTLKRREYEGILSTIKTSNAVLRDLSTVNRKLEPDRRRRSQLRVTKLLRQLCKSLYNALHDSLTCSCFYSHDIGLRLSRMNAVILPSDVDREVAQRFGFHITLRTFEATNEDEIMKALQHSKREQPVSYWKKLELRPMSEEQPSLAPGALPAISTTSAPNKRVRWSQSITFKLSKRSKSLLDATRPTAQASIPSQATTATVTAPPTRVSDLCHMVHKRANARSATVSYYGYVLDNEYKFLLSRPSDETGVYKHATLRQVITGQLSGLPPLDFGEKLRVALALSASILHLDGTQWLAQVVTLDNILFMHGGENSNGQPASPLYQPFIVRHVPNTTAFPAPAPSGNPMTPTAVTQDPSKERPIDLALMSLGALLIQIIIGRVENGLEMADALDMDSMVLKWERGHQLAEEVLIKGGENYAAAVKWCFDSIRRVGGLQSNMICQDFYEAVVTRLEDDLKIITSD
ncbi:hypothetical protein F4802DRAFT_607720 [Xylaria palmicola]|nr:hypothetical protein F4802DRAFT_607720 [Xylaria palmicola]